MFRISGINLGWDQGASQCMYHKILGSIAGLLLTDLAIPINKHGIEVMFVYRELTYHLHKGARIVTKNCG